MARADGATKIDAPQVMKMLTERRLRRSRIEDRTQESIREGLVLIDTDGTRIGQVNGLSVLEIGGYSFGKPVRITATAALGKSGLINIEGAVNLSGPIHDKGVMILEGFLLQEFGGDGPLCLQATICFEQLYNGVEGDSASLAQLLALLSSVARVPLDQGLAVSGSINQKGEVQAVGSVNEKIEGFYRLCKARRLTGRQGVLIPRANASDLMLDQEVVDAVQKGEFAVYAASHVDEALELFARRPAREVLAGVREHLARYRKAVGLP